MEAEECLRALADEAVQRAEGGALVLHGTLGMRAAANALVLLGLLPEQQADKIMNGYQEALQQRSLGTAWGLTDGELPARSGAGDIWSAHVAGPSPLAGVPQAMAPAAVTFPATISGLKAELRLEWVKLASRQWRISFRATAADLTGEPDRPSVVMREALGLFTMTDDAGHRYRHRVEDVTWERTGGGRQEWRGELVADARPDVPAPAALLISSMESGTTETIPLAPHAQDPGGGAVVTAATSSRWPSPAEGYLADLARARRVRVGWTDVEADKTAEIVAIVADCLLATGALPVTSPLLRGEAASVPAPGWREALAARWARRGHHSGATTDGTGQQRVLLASLPFERAAAVIESVAVTETAAGRLVGVTLQGSPWVPAAPWPVLTPCFSVHAATGDGATSEGVLEDFQPATAGPAGAAPAGRGTFWLWPPVPAGTAELEITVGTLWEAVTARAPLPPAGAPDGPQH